VIGADGEQLGVMSPETAIEQAQESGLDLVEVAANSRPPVCRIMDYGRYKYEQKQKKGKQSSHAASLKEIKMRPGTDMHDLQFKLNNARKFLMDGDKVKVTVMFRGREMGHTQRGRKQLDQVRTLLEPIAKMENAPRMEGRFMSMILVADREVVAEAKRAAEAEADAGAETTDGATTEGGAKEDQMTEAVAKNAIAVEATEGSATKSTAEEPEAAAPE